MVHLASLIARNPLQFLKFCYTFTTQCALDVAERLILPHCPTYQTLRIRFTRAYLAAAALHLPDIVHRLPVTNCPSSRARLVSNANWTGYVIPGTRDLAQLPAGGTFAVVLYAHGGGYVRGEARQYLNYMERWIRVARQREINLVFVSVEYRTYPTSVGCSFLLTHIALSPEASHPAQRDSFVHGYRYILDQGVSASKIVFMGDSAGGSYSEQADAQTYTD